MEAGFMCHGLCPSHGPKPLESRSLLCGDDSTLQETSLGSKPFNWNGMTGEARFRAHGFVPFNYFVTT